MEDAKVDLKTSRYMLYNGVNYPVGSIITMSNLDAMDCVSKKYGKVLTEEEEEEEEIKKEEVKKEKPHPLLKISDMFDEHIAPLGERGIDTISKLANAEVGDLVKIKGIGKKTAEKYIENANIFLED